MVWNRFEIDREKLKTQYKIYNWNKESGLEPDSLMNGCEKIIKKMADKPKIKVKASLFDFILNNAQIEVNPEDWFPDKIRHGNIIEHIRKKWYKNIVEIQMKECLTKNEPAILSFAYTGEVDFGHTSPDWNAIMELGIPGLLKRIQNARAGRRLSAEQVDFYDACETVYRASLVYINRLADEAKRLSAGNERMKIVADSLRNLSAGPPKTLLEAMHLFFLYYNLQNNIEQVNIRSLGGLDRLLYGFYKADISTGRYTQEQVRELVKYFYCKFNAMQVVANIPFFLCGLGADGKDTTNELSYLFVEEYRKLNIHDPKIHIRYNGQIPNSFLELVFSTIREGKNSFLFINDKVTEHALIDLGHNPEDARNYTVIGCYEPAALGKEVPCSCSGRISLPKAVELALNDGIDPLLGHRIGPAPMGKIASFKDFYDYYKSLLMLFADNTMDMISSYEKNYMKMNPSPMFSSTFKNCVDDGIDAYAGGAKYNNSSINAFGIATAVDSLIAIKKAVYEEKRFSLNELSGILRKNWQDNDKLRLFFQKNYPKYGNNITEVDELMTDLTGFITSYINKKPNGRGGLFRCGMFSIDWIIPFGANTGATPDGRSAGEPFSKNMCAVISRDKEGVTSLINSVTKIDYTKVPNGTVLDLMLHPTAVEGEEGIIALSGILKTYMQQGGFALQYNILNPETLKAAQENPEQYSNLQVRLCGWNVYFVNLSREEQNEFIKQAENF